MMMIVRHLTAHHQFHLVVAIGIDLLWCMITTGNMGQVAFRNLRISIAGVGLDLQYQSSGRIVRKVSLSRRVDRVKRDEDT